MNDPNLTEPQSTPTWVPVPAAPIALKIAFEALSGTSMAGAAPIVIDALGDADVLQAPGENAELRSLVTKATGYSALYRQTCQNNQHREWFAEVAEAVPCPWCELAELQAAAGYSYSVTSGGQVIGTYRSPEAAGTHAQTDLRQAYPQASWRWAPHPDVPNVSVLQMLVEDAWRPTGYHVVKTTILPAYTSEADA